MYDNGLKTLNLLLLVDLGNISKTGSIARPTFSLKQRLVNGTAKAIQQLTIVVTVTWYTIISYSSR